MTGEEMRTVRLVCDELVRGRHRQGGAYVSRIPGNSQQGTEPCSREYILLLWYYNKRHRRGRMMVSPQGQYISQGL